MGTANPLDGTNAGHGSEESLRTPWKPQKLMKKSKLAENSVNWNDESAKQVVWNEIVTKRVADWNWRKRTYQK